VTRGRVEVLWRYPVKSMLGERLDRAEVSERGIEGDRAFAVLDPASGRVLSAKREPALFQCRARRGNDGSVTVTLPDGKELSADEPQLEVALYGLLGREVHVIEPRGEERTRIEMGETSATTSGEASEFSGPAGMFFDSAPIHIVTTSSLKALREMVPSGRIDERRFRPNFLVDVGETASFIEEGWVGQRVSIGGTVEIEVLKPCGRCVMVTHAQDELPKDRAVLQTVARRNDNNLGVLGTVITPGAVALGDEVVLS
jgi:uncharacterized protein